ncbi:hypothetical protein RI129_009278 [Pyrocoelia pectoralis]|uniref:BAG domain-containing protein n=1 Tax=Pyrocoelia pectoralis TaxID=417401 RepID=A0AAN7ZHP7_9COLE
MGGKIAKPQLQRKKSLSKIGRSSQRGLFQKSKLKLSQIQRKLDDANCEQLQCELETVEKELKNISDVVKDKHREKYEEILHELEETRQKFEQKFKIPINEVDIGEDRSEVVQVHTPDAPEVVEMRKSQVIGNTPPESPKIKFGVQVIPAMPRVSQEMLKNTSPTSPIAKEEFAEIRASYVNSTSSKTVFHSTSIVEDNGVITNVSRISIEQNTIEKVASCVDELENAMKYYHGTKGDFEYDVIHDRLVQNLIKLDNFDTNDNPVLKQDKKILIQRIQDLMSILDRLSRPTLSSVIENVPKGDIVIGTT